MRYDTTIFFQRIMAGAYDEATGDYGPETIVETKCFASVRNTGIETLNLIYGELKQGSMTVQLLQHYNEPFDRIRIGEKVYRVDFQRRLHNKHTFVVSGVQ